VGSLQELPNQVSKKINDKPEGRTHPFGFSALALTLTLFAASFLFDITWVQQKGYAGLVPWWIFFRNGLLIYGGLAFAAFILSPLIGWFFRPTGSGWIIDRFAGWWLFMTIILVHFINDEFSSGNLSLANPPSVIITLITILVSIALLRFIGYRLARHGRGGSKRGIYIAFILLVLIGLPLGYNMTKPGSAPPAGGGEGNRPPNIILITLDTLRADHLGIYGYDKKTTPNIDGFARDSIVFENAFTPIPLTTPAHVSIMTGNLPQSHMIFQNTSVFDGSPISKPNGKTYENTAIGTILRENGYETFSAVSAIHLNNKFGWGHCADSLNEYEPPYSNPFLRSTFQLAPIRFVSAALRLPFETIRKSDSVIGCFLEWETNRQSDRPFFTWLHCFDVHLPFDPPGEYIRKFDPDYTGKLSGSSVDVTKYNEHREELAAKGVDLERYLVHVNACYDAELFFMDEQFGRLTDELKGRELYDDALIIICADHGEGFGERDYIGHNAVPFDCEMHVPLIVKPPRYSEAGRRVGDPVTLCDIAPTIYDTLGIEPGITMDGSSFSSILKGSDHISEFDWPVPGMVFLVAHSLRWDDRQIVRSLDRESERVVWSYYDLVADPGAFNDLYESEGVLPEVDKFALIGWIDETVADFKYLSVHAHENEDLDDWTIEQLKAVGYLN